MFLGFDKNQLADGSLMKIDILRLAEAYRILSDGD